MKRIMLLVGLAVSVIPAFATQVIQNENLDSFFKETSRNTANAICFMYEGNHYKCACRFGNNSKIWVSKPMAEFIGELGTMNDKYGFIEACQQ